MFKKNLFENIHLVIQVPFGINCLIGKLPNSLSTMQILT
ncbi:hypothetical protein M086_0977 [Bacteroides fragilis str. S13 L11]|nr:hypothetical protein M086_0977 [Bacteroides fragilis str. S13 L11]